MLGLIFALWLGAAACSGAEEDPEDPYQADIESALSQATSDFEREVLGRGEITRADYEEAVDRYVKCAADHGVVVEAVPQGGYYVYSYPASEEADRVVDLCMEGTIELIGTLYVERLTNPNKEDHVELIVRCFIRNELVEPGYTADQFDLDMEARDLPFDDSDPRFSACMANPSQG